MPTGSIQRMDWAADDLSRVGDLRTHALGLFAIASVASELAAIRAALTVPRTAFPIDSFDEEEWAEIMIDLRHTVGPAIETDTLSGWARSARPTWHHTVAFQIDRLLRCLHQATGCVDQEGGAIGLLLPISFADRVDFLLGSAQVPLAWVRQLDGLKF